ncbi:hypothetical protein ACUIJQ_02520 [Levilactobacillus hammesii]|uniref:Uncharacterized protein n=1 Tax=Levilactobacillus hammesii DSM 16381 TaxID=1423753 RepID=A0A0R1UPX3_9LACO|nr:hypothetical protein [Levilactobacillus hammesii]KRL93448.1 hypothetical protein FD28_GL001330 [Levilactobacillus hammesii DSM 16381]
MNSRIVIESLVLLIIFSLLVFLIFSLITDFRTTLLLILLLTTVGFIKTHFFKKTHSR